MIEQGWATCDPREHLIRPAQNFVTQVAVQHLVKTEHDKQVLRL